ncbi:MAG: hypothetical protein ABSA41_18045 [Terriglobia bacterium]|jgi:hypothetical protein
MNEITEDLIGAVLLGLFVWWDTKSANVASLVAVAALAVGLLYRELRLVNRNLQSIEKKLDRPN